MKLPEPRKIEIEIFGENAFLQERTAQERYLIQGALSSQNGDTSLDYILTIQSLEYALACNVKLGFWNWRKNAKFKRRGLKKRLRMSQIEFLLEQINKLEMGDDYKEDEKKKDSKGTKVDRDVIRGTISGAGFGIDYWMVEELPYHWYHEMLEQAINQGCWRGGSELKLTKGQSEGTTGDPEVDFWKMAKKGKFEWICKNCLKNNGSMGHKKECECSEDL